MSNILLQEKVYPLMDEGVKGVRLRQPTVSINQAEVFRYRWVSQVFMVRKIKTSVYSHELCRNAAPPGVCNANTPTLRADFHQLERARQVANLHHLLYEQKASPNLPLLARTQTPLG